MSGRMEPEEKQKNPSLVELKNGKVHLKQKNITFEKQSETLQEIVLFRHALEERMKHHGPPFSTIPDEYRPLIAKLSHESDKTLTALSKHIQQELLSNLDGNEGESSREVTLAILPLSAIEAAIKAIMSRNNYGLDGIGGGKAPAAVCVWRWEVKEEHRDWLPKNVREKAESRLMERVQAKNDLLALFEAMPQETKNAILTPKGSNKLPQKELNVTDSPNSIQVPPEEKHRPPKKQTSGEENDTSLRSQVSRKNVDSSKASMEKKTAKAEKERKEKDAQDKSRTLMANFFSKQHPRPPTKVEAGVPSTQSEFSRTFKPFVLKKDAELAPINYFLATKSRWRVDDEVIVINDDDERESQSQSDVSSMNTADHLQSIVSSFSPGVVGRSRRHLSFKQYKTYHPLCVRNLYSKLSEAEVAGDDAIVRSMIAQLNNRSALTAKVIIFFDDARPGYFGTWTKSSQVIGPRTPFARDVLVFDYGYDSGQEWEDEPTGDADDVADEGEDEDEGDESDSDLDGWLVGDDDEPETPLADLDQMPHELLDLQPLPAKRKADNAEKAGKRRKTVILLVPFTKGPCWESSIGRCEPMFDSYKIQLFNDTPFSIDPFTFVSTCLEDSNSGMKLMPQSKPSLMDDSGFVVPSVPEHSNRLSTGAPQTTSGSSVPPVHEAGKKISVKTPFPDMYLPFLLERITSLQSGSMNFLIEAVYRDLRQYKVTKNAIEAKIREVAEKSEKLWVLKPSVQVPP